LKTDIRFRKGDSRFPLAVFIHGLGVNADFWTDPARAKVLGGKYPLGILLPEGVEQVTSYSDLAQLGFSVLTWSQSRPAGPIQAAVAELRGILEEYSGHGHHGVLLICHSRGGLVARKYLEDPWSPPRMVMTIATPHAGTSMAKWAAFMSPLASALDQAIENLGRREADTAFRRILRFLGSSGLRELLPGSAFCAGLRDVKRDGTRYVSIGGTDPNLLKTVAIPLPELLMKIIPEKVFPEEMRDGFGDGLVTAASAVLPYGDEHGNYHLNHAALLFDRGVRDFITDAVQPLTG
jgi:pimeloyl-ACP methyl ester carboxylesterase